MATEELAWAAGFFDAEGNVLFQRKPGFIRVAIAQVDRAPLDRFLAAVGDGRVTGPTSKPHGLGRRPQWTYRLYRRPAVARVLAALWLKLGEVKREQAARVLAEARAARPSITCRYGHAKTPNKPGCPACVSEYWSRFRAQRDRGTLFEAPVPYLTA